MPESYEKEHKYKLPGIICHCNWVTDTHAPQVVKAFLNKFHNDGRPEDYLAVYECFLQSISTDAEDVAEVILKHPIYDYIRPEEMSLMLHGDSQVCLIIHSHSIIMSPQ